MSQNAEFDKSLEIIKVPETDNMDTKLRVESIETWLIKLNDNVEDVSVRVDTQDTNRNLKCSEHVENTMKALQNEFVALKETIAITASSQSKSLTKMKSCKECGEVFLRNYEFENHMVHVQGFEKTNKSDICGKTFFLK